ncbi:MAG: AI-2E family transporter [Coxiellaceae bacterium]|nr:AI-2E family transporter [Coxiellaceae bacterium]
MNDTFRNFVQLFVTVAIIVVTYMVMHRFIGPLAWAAVIVISTFPMFQWLDRLLGKRHSWAAFIFTFVIFLIIAIPLSWIITVMVQESQTVISFLNTANTTGQATPEWLHHIPWFGDKAIAWWQKTLGQAGGLNAALNNLHISLTPVGGWLRKIGSSVAYSGMSLLFIILCLFFLYRDGPSLSVQIEEVGQNLLNERWTLYARQLPGAIRATVNGTVFTGIGMGILMGISYAIAGVPAPVILGAITAVAAMIPFAIILVMLIAVFMLLIKSKIVAAICIIIWGVIVNFASDHYVRPKMIGGATKLPFLPILFGILGGAELMGLLGLFIGPVIMILFITLWEEFQK